ncbi:hypothetical protein MNBD_DELTA04-1820 [hydrothermal vent metagenome]|uniref:Periplasmic protein YibQ, distant homology with nucleoside diphosphatase and polysaccharide deacetylase n=1 Tax=hydrothermal vent metagenome TaxID=652676 RepID=A0A3B0VQ27_9ZZZZ
MSGRRLPWLRLCLVLLLAGVAVFSIRQQEEQRPPGQKQDKTVIETGPTMVGPETTAPVFEEPAPPAPEQPGQSGAEGGEKSGAGEQELPRVAIIIDDMGYHRRLGAELLALDMNLTFSFLPHAPATAEQAEQAWQTDHDILVHMPMEARDPAFNPGPGALYLKDSPAKIRSLAAENLALVPHAIGMNNHMGSRYTENRPAMHEVLALLRQKGFFYVDSMTTPRSVGMDEARKMGIKTGRRRVFLDNVKTRKDICHQLGLLVAAAKKYGQAIGIGHPDEAMLQALTRCRDHLLRQVRIVGVHELVR